MIFPKDATGTVRAVSLLIVLTLWSNVFREAFLQLYDFFRRLTFSLSNRSPGITDQLFESLSRIPWFQLTLACLTLGVVVRLFVAVKQGTMPAWLDKFRATNLSTRLNVLVLSVFFVGIYFSVASLCTIPTLQVNQPFSEDERTQVTTQIDAYNPTDDVFNKQFPESPAFQNDEVFPLRTLVFQATGERIQPACRGVTPAEGASLVAAPQDTTAPTPSVTSRTEAKVLNGQPELLADIRASVREYDARRCALLAQYQDMRPTAQQIIHTEAGKIKDQVNSNFALRLTGRDRADYLYTLKSSYQNLSNTVLTTLSRCRSAVQSSVFGYSFIVDNYEHALQEATQTSQNATLASYPLRLVVDVGTSPCIFDNLSWATTAVAPAPSLGIFSLFFGWLEDSDSLALAVLCGMLGVGLVGCIVSSFIRRGERVPGSPWISDPFPVIVRGFTAAVVVYLAIEGGLNIFSTASNQANPYVLLFACLIGSVFSEDVWVAARKRLPSAEPSQVSGVEPTNTGDDGS